MTRRLVTTLLLYLAIILVFRALQPAELDWTETYDHDDRGPFGTFILYERLPDLFPDASITRSKQPVYNLRRQQGNFTGAMIAINHTLWHDRLDVSALLQMVREGSTVFLSAERLSQPLLDSLDLEMASAGLTFPANSSWMYRPQDHLTLSCCPGRSWEVPTRGTVPYFVLSDSDSSKVLKLGEVREGQVNYLRYRYGEGTLYLHSFPLALTNFYFLNSDMRAYASLVLSHLPEAEMVTWDSHYKGVPGGGNPFAVLARRPAFRWAYWLVLTGGMIFLFFGAKRRQRVIPVLAPRRNTSLDFIRTIGDLYYQNGDHRDLVQKKLTYFQEHLREQYRFHLTSFSNDAAEAVARRAGRDAGSTRRMFQEMQRLESANRVSAADLRTLQHHLDIFYQRTTT